VTVQLELVPPEQPSRVTRDRLELLTALLHGPGVDEIYRQEVIEFPADDPVYGWGCTIPECGCPRVWIDGARMCQTHYKQWLTARAAGSTRAEFNSSAVALKGTRTPLQECQICPGRPVLSRSTTLCRRHDGNWAYHRDQMGRSFEDWLAEQQPYPGYGRWQVVVCVNLAESPLGFCGPHRENYHDAGRPGGARLPMNWVRRFEDQGLPVPLGVDDPAALRAWCRTARTVRHGGEVSLLGLRPLLMAELQWGLHRHALRNASAHWALGWIRAFVHYCRVRDLACLDAVDIDDCSHTDRMMTVEIRNELRLVYFSPADSKEAGFIETEHFGRRLSVTSSYFDLTGVEVRWLRDLLWDHLAARLRSAQCPRSRKPFDGLRHGAQALSAFLVLDAPAGGQDPRLLHAEHMQRFVADVRHREREGLPQLGWRRADREPSILTEHTRRDIFNYARRLLADALESGETNWLGLDPKFTAALPNGGDNKKISRNPFTDEVARALVDETNLARLGGPDFDPYDRGYRDVWETIAATGRRCSEVLNLRLDCIGHYNGLPMLWHDQTKVGNYNAGIRIPQRIYDVLDARRRKTLVHFEHRNARQPTPQERVTMALFPSRTRNRGEARAIAYTAFNRPFRDWVASLDLGHCVAHQARHTLATKLLKHGATLSHIRQYLGQVSERMAEHYTNPSGIASDGRGSAGRLIGGGA
jgi:integrase